ncbi:hypothetical protein [Blautia sp. HCP3S3_C4]|uniref:hypothetical protein n=1 Tax=Blautia sp. HCP3S3_C4 TaxID=3438911 RepID=UPI003F8B7937
MYKVNSEIKKSIVEIVAKHKNNDKYFMFGLEYFGPFLYGYTNWLYKEINHSGCDKIFFFSRDGYMMKKAYNLFDSKSNSEYVYFSRKSIRQALLHTFSSYKDSLKYLTWERFITLGKLLEYYGFDECQRNEIANKYGLNLFQDYEYDKLATSEELIKLYDFLKDDININSIEQDKLLLKYIEQIGMNGTCAIVDIGWHGSMQYFLEQFIEAHNLKTVLKGFYVGICPNVPIKGTVAGYIYDETNLYLRKSLLCFFGGYEKLFQSCEGSTYGYVEHEDKIIPVLAKYEYEDQQKFIDCIGKWQEGALVFVKENMLQIGNYIDDKQWAMPLVEFGKNPPLRGIELFSFFYNTDGTKAYFISQKSLFRYKPKELIHALSNSVWKTGFMKSVFKLPLPYFKIYCLLRK